MFCLKCGSKLSENATYCPMCGTKPEVVAWQANATDEQGGALAAWDCGVEVVACEGQHGVSAYDASRPVTQISAIMTRQKMLEALQPIIDACETYDRQTALYYATAKQLEQVNSKIASAEAACDPREQAVEEKRRLAEAREHAAANRSFKSVLLDAGDTAKSFLSMAGYFVGLLVVASLVWGFIVAEPALGSLAKGAITAAAIMAAFFGWAYVSSRKDAELRKRDEERKQAEAVEGYEQLKASIPGLRAKAQRLQGALDTHLQRAQSAWEEARNDIFTEEQTNVAYLSLVKQVVYNGEADSWKEANQVVALKLHQATLEQYASEQAREAAAANKEQQRMAEEQARALEEQQRMAEDLSEVVEFYRQRNERRAS